MSKATYADATQPVCVAEGCEAPERDLEQLVARISRELLPVEHVATNDNFFQLGADSMVALQLVTRLSEVLKLRIHIAMIFQFPTVGELAQCIGRLQSESRNCAQNGPQMLMI